MSARPVVPGMDEALAALEAALGHARGRDAGANIVHDARMAPPAPPGPDRISAIEVAALLGRVREDLLIADLGIGPMSNWKVPAMPAPAPPGSFPTDAVQLPRTPRDGVRAPERQRYTARDLMALREEGFVTATYRALLGREPDREGLQYFTAELHEGRMSRTDMIARLRRSPEGKAAKARVPGLWGMLARERIARLPVIGYLYRAALGVARLPYLAARLDLMEHRDHQTARSLNQVSALSEAVFTELRRGQAQLFHTANQLAERINSLLAANADRMANVRGLARHIRRLDESLAAVRALDESFAAKSELQAVGRAAGDALAALRAAMEGAHSELEDSRGRALRAETALDALRTELRSFEEQARAHMREASTSLENAGKQIADLTSGLHGLAGEARGGLGHIKAELADVAARLADVTSGLHGFAFETRAHFERVDADVKGAAAGAAQVPDLASGLHGFAAETRGQLKTLGESVNEQQRRMARLSELLASASGLPAGHPGREALDAHRARLLDSFYVEFERRFRGERAEIKARFEVYVPLLREAGVAKRAPLLDIGCGRGELLELLRDNGIAAHGIDVNGILVEQCRQLGLPASEADAMTHLRGVKDGALGAVSGMHIAEHFEFPDLVALLDEVFRVLRRGGVAVFETPNPENLIVGACTFWLDPTHVKPLPPDALRFLAEARGFAPVDVLRLNPFPESEHLPGGEPMARLNRLLYGARDYAIVARKPE